MDGHSREDLDELQRAEAPEDVAVLYSWANLKGAKYRDFSASRREYRAQLRHRAAEAQRDAELKAKSEAEFAAAATERAAREAEEAARFHEAQARKASDERRVQESAVQGVARDQAIRQAAELNRRAVSERVEAARRAEAVAAAEAAARREARELAEAQVSAQRQAARYAESEHLRRSLGQENFLPGPLFDPYEEGQPVDIPGRSFPRPTPAPDDLGPIRIPRSRDPLSIVPQAGSHAQRDAWAGEKQRRISRAPEGATQMDPVLDSDVVARAPARYSYEPNSQERVAAVDQYAQYAHYAPYADAAQRENASAAPLSRYEEAATEAARRNAEVTPRPRGFHPDVSSGLYKVPREDERGSATPAWLHGQMEDAGAEEAPLRSSSSALPPDTLQESRERVASRWYALKGAFEGDAPDLEPGSAAAYGEALAPLAAVFSLAGGVGKTSMVATLGRALSASGESVLLADTTSHGLLPFYFGASELKPGVVRRFSPPPGSPDAAIALVSYETAGREADPGAGGWLAEELTEASRGMQRVLLDMSPASGWVLRRLARLTSQVIVPVAPDMNSVISLGSVEKFFAGVIDSRGQALLPYYLLNGFDASLPLHLDVREVMRQQLGERLLPFVIRRSPSVSEALAEGMTVVDYAPDSSAAADYMNLAAWLRMQSAPAVPGSKNSRWSER